MSEPNCPEEDGGGPPGEDGQAEAAGETVEVRAATVDDVPGVMDLLAPFAARRQLLQRGEVEVRKLVRNGFVAVDQARIVGFAAIEIYSRKLAEVQGLAVRDSHQRRGIGRRLIACCVQRARQQQVLEVMAITNSEVAFRQCGFDYSLPDQKRAVFLRTRADD